MSESETEMQVSEKKILDLESVFKALASSRRLKILAFLHLNEDSCAKEIASELELSQPDISYHLSLLCRSGIVVKRKEGTRNCYYINRKKLESFGIYPESFLLGGETR